MNLGSKLVMGCLGIFQFFQLTTGNNVYAQHPGIEKIQSRFTCSPIAPFVREQSRLLSDRRDPILFLTNDSVNQEMNQKDSIAWAYRPGLGDVSLQVLAGTVGFSLPFWGLGWRLRNLDGQSWISPSYIIGFFTSPLCIALTTDLLHTNDANTEIGVLGGAGVSMLFSFLLDAVFHQYSDENIPRTYTVDVITTVSMSVLIYDLTILLH
jgi:hypothetical protein